MEFLWFLIIAVVSGIFAGMGMGGGTFLIPLITLLMNVPQNIAQCINLLVFVPMAVVNIVVYSRKKLIDFKNWWWVSIPACLVSLVGSLLAADLSDKILKISFGVFISLIGIIQLLILVFKSKQKTKVVKNCKK